MVVRGERLASQYNSTVKPDEIVIAYTNAGPYTVSIQKSLQYRFSFLIMIVYYPQISTRP